MQFKQFTTNGWLDDSGHYVIVANYDRKSFAVRHYKKEFSISDLLLNTENPYEDLGIAKTDVEAISIAENHCSGKETTKQFIDYLREYLPGKSEEIYNAIITIIDSIKNN